MSGWVSPLQLASKRKDTSRSVMDGESPSDRASDLGYAAVNIAKEVAKDPTTYMGGLGFLMSPGDAEAGVFDVGSRLYRGIPRLAGAGNNLSEIPGLRAMTRSRANTPAAKANVGQYVWATDNPLTASSYAHTGGGVMPLELLKAPDITLDAGGKHWEDYFFDRNGKPLSPKISEFYRAFKDPEIKSIGVKNIVDPGTDAWKYGDSWQDFMSNNLLMKDPSIVKYLLTGEKANFSNGGLVCLKGKKNG